MFNFRDEYVAKRNIFEWNFYNPRDLSVDEAGQWPAPGSRGRGGPGETQMKAVQKFSDDYLQRCREMSKDVIARLLEDFRCLHGGGKSPSRLISLKVPGDLLEAFRAKSRLTGTPYQTKIKELMSEWVRSDRS